MGRMKDLLFDMEYDGMLGFIDENEDFKEKDYYQISKEIREILDKRDYFAEKLENAENDYEVAKYNIYMKKLKDKLIFLITKQEY